MNYLKMILRTWITSQARGFLLQVHRTARKRARVICSNNSSDSEQVIRSLHSNRDDVNDIIQQEYYILENRRRRGENR